MAVVLSIVPYKFLPPKIGGQKGIALFNEYFGRYVNLTCVTVNSNENEYAKGYEAIAAFSNSQLRYANPFTVFRLKKLIKEKKATHILLEHPYMGWMAYLLKKLMSTKLIVHSHNMEGLRFKTLGKWWWKLLWQYERFVHRHADYNFFIQENDRQYAIMNFGLDAAKCIVVTYGIEINSIPTALEVEKAKNYVREKHGISPTEKILMFAGSFNYKPNLDALEYIDKKVAPLLAQKNFKCKILICGPWLESNSSSYPNVILTGFVDDISLYFKAADVFLNPVVEGGGIKTKLVEALGYNTNSVSSTNGAIGVDPSICNGKLTVTEDNDWEAFANGIINVSEVKTDISPEYYQHFYWGYSTKKAAEFIQQDA
ncbi:MAG TPA: glycosyltransferase family 4 protein [Flavisolibacter sp.]|jgi:glycosyltransferase involved in cell wall biosynthesis|nr:glycosyltransferase family 4 protein [Flavisolibacter sp.]